MIQLSFFDIAKRPRWHVHFTPTSASWINQVERWFAQVERWFAELIPRSATKKSRAFKKARQV